MKRAIIEVTPAFLIEMCKADSNPRYVRVVENALPDDAHCVGGYYDSIRDVIQLAVQSEVFADVPDPVKSPVLPSPVFKIVEVSS